MGEDLFFYCIFAQILLYCSYRSRKECGRDVNDAYKMNNNAESAASVLVCDDEPDIVSALKIYLESDGFRVLTASNGREALCVAAREPVQLVLMDIMMPEMDGITAMRRLRETTNVPVILLTAKGEDNDKVLGLTEGADDYVTKPFSPGELLARVRSQLRRYTLLGSAPTNQTAGSGLRVGGFVLDEREKTVTLDGTPLMLTPTEYEILRLFLRHPGEVLSPKEIYARVWQETPIGAENTVAVHIRHLREKIEIEPANPRYLKVVWAQGYRFEAGGD